MPPRYGFKVDYPNDLWDIQLTDKRIGRDFDPSIGFVPRRRSICTTFRSTTARASRRDRFSRCSTSSDHRWRPISSGRWESYRVFFAPVNWRFRSGDRFELNVNPTGERLVEPFEIADGVVIPPGSYHWMRYRVEVGHRAEAPALRAGHLVVRRFL